MFTSQPIPLWHPRHLIFILPWHSAQPGGSVHMSTSVLLVQPSIIPSQNTRLSLWHFLQCNTRPPPIFPFSPPALQGSGCHSVFPVTTLLVPSSAVSPNPPLSIRPKHGGWHKPASALQWFCCSWGWAGTWSSLDAVGGGGGSLIDTVVRDHFHHTSHDLQWKHGLRVVIRWLMGFERTRPKQITVFFIKMAFSCKRVFSGIFFFLLEIKWAKQGKMKSSLWH